MAEPIDTHPAGETNAPRGKMTDDDLLTLIAQYERASLGSQIAAGMTVSTTIFPSNQTLTTLEIDRFNALNAYLARPLGNEIENRSQVVLPVLRDTVEWMMPQLMRIFAASKTICRFDPESPQDENQAEIETAVINHVFMQQNNGFFVLHDFFKDALLLRNGYVEVYTKEETKVCEEKYTQLSQIELAQLLQDTADEKLEVLEQREYKIDIRLPLPQLPMGAPPPQGPLVTQIPVWDLKIRRTKTEKNVSVTCLPPEEMRVSTRAREGMEDSIFSMHLTTMARSDLITEGYDREWVQSLAQGRPNWLDMDSLARSTVVDQLSVENPSDFSMQEIELRKVVLKVDFDGDGVAELRRVVIGGDKVGENEVIEETPFVSCEPMRMPHRHTGISLYDLVMDLQIISTNLWRQGLDNLTIANNQRVAVDWQSANFDDLLTSRPGGVVRGKGPPNNWIMSLEQPSNLVQQVLPALSYIDQLRSNRTGIGKGTMGLDADELQNVTKGGQLAAMSAATLILELIARLLAEGVKYIFQKIHSELIRHQDKPLSFEISGKWVTVDPSSWKRRSKITPNVGLGSGNREEMRANIQILLAAQTQLLQVMMTMPPQVYNKTYETFKLLCESLGFSNPERFALDPDSNEYKQMIMQRQNQPQQPAPQVQAAQIRAQTEQQKQGAEDQREILKLQGELIQQKESNLHEQQQNLAQIQHEGVQGHKDREVQLDQNHLQIILKLIPALAQIMAAEKRDPKELGQDVQTVDAEVEGKPGIHEQLMQTMGSLTQAITNMGRPRVATLSDGRQIRIE